jgi:hypothetical protein
MLYIYILVGLIFYIGSAYLSISDNLLFIVAIFLFIITIFPLLTTIKNLKIKIKKPNLKKKIKKFYIVISNAIPEQ